MWHSSSSTTLTPTSLILTDITMRYFFKVNKLYIVVGSDHLRVIPMKQSLVLAKIGDFMRI